MHPESKNYKMGILFINYSVDNKNDHNKIDA